MREILFRGKSIDNGEWVYGYYTMLPKGDIGATIMVGGDELLCEDTAAYIVEIATKQASSFSPAYPIQVFDADICEVRDETVGQYTGLTDDNGKKIFEGDIVADYNGVKGLVEFFTEDIGSCGCCVPKFDGSGFKAKHKNDDDGVDMRSCTVLGNIYDNPELLEVKS